MDDAERRSLLEAVAAGDLDPDEAAQRLAGGRTAEPEDDVSEPADHVTPPPSDAPTAKRVRIEAAGAAMRIIGDPDITGVLVDGEHEIEERDGAIVVRCQPLRNLVGAGSTFQIHSLGSHRRFDFGSVAAGMRTTVRMNPRLPLDIDLNAGSVSVRGTSGPISLDMNAGAANLREVLGPIDASVNAGALTIDSRLDRGDSTIRCDMGATTIRLAPGSNVRVSAGVDLGRRDIRLPAASDGSGDHVVGDGRASLKIKGSMSSVTVTSES